MGDPEHDSKEGHRRDHTQRAWFPLHGLPGSKERWISNQSKKSEQVCSHRIVQDKGHPCLERPAKSRKLDDKSGPEGCILHGTNTPGGQSLPQIHFPGKDIPIQMPALWPVLCVKTEPREGG